MRTNVTAGRSPSQRGSRVRYFVTALQSFYLSPSNQIYSQMQGASVPATDRMEGLFAFCDTESAVVEKVLSDSHPSECCGVRDLVASV